MDKRIFDNPDHPQYGPVRRLWVMLVQLGIIGWDGQFKPKWEGSIIGTYRAEWDETLAHLIEIGVDEDAAQREILFNILNHR